MLTPRQTDMAKIWFWPFCWPWPWPCPIRAEAELKNGHFGFSLKSIGRYLKIVWQKNDFDLFGDLDHDLVPSVQKQNKKMDISVLVWSPYDDIWRFYGKETILTFLVILTLTLCPPKWNGHIPVPLPTYGENFMKFHSAVFPLYCWRTNRETKKQRNKPNQKQYLFRLSSGRGNNVQ